MEQFLSPWMTSCGRNISLERCLRLLDSTTNAPATKNIYNVASEPMWTTMGIEGIKALSARGVMFCVCDVALSVYSGFAAKAMSGNPERNQKGMGEWLAAGCTVVPSGVWGCGPCTREKDALTLMQEVD